MRFATLGDAARMKEIHDHPDVAKWDTFDGCKGFRPENFLTEGSFTMIFDDGCFMFKMLKEQVYACHVNFLPAMRGASAVAQARKGLTKVFSETDCQVLIAIVPTFNKKSMWYTVKCGFKRYLVRTAVLPFQGKKHDLVFYTLHRRDYDFSNT